KSHSSDRCHDVSPMSKNYAIAFALKSRHSRKWLTMPRRDERNTGRPAMPRTLIAICLFSAVLPSLVMAQGKGVRFWNLTTATVSGFQLSPAGKDNWGPKQSLNDNDKEV